MKARKLAVFGNPVSHSRSPEIHDAFARQAGIDVSYDRILAPEDGFDSAVRQFVESGGIGFNVTLPFKEQAYRLVSSCSAEAETANAVNTVTVNNEGLRGDNTDGGGLVKDLSTNLDWPLAGQRVLVLGAGGAVRGVLGALLQAEPARVDLYNRTQSRAEHLVNHFQDSRLQVCKVLRESYDLIVNGTSAGLKGESIQLPSAVVGSRTRSYDMIYGPRVTPFNAWCREQGCAAVADGLGMLVEQAALSFFIWFGFNADTAPVILALRNSINETDV
ncbi:MAG: shikimate dehydrogenase [Pseudomonadales bacterium]